MSILPLNAAKAIFEAFCIFLFFSALIGPACFAAMVDADYRVNVSGRLYYVSPNGDDDAGGTKDSPYLTIQRAANVAEAGDAVLVAPGIYRERVAPVNGGAEGSPIIYRAKPGGGVVIKGSEVWTPNWTVIDASKNIVEATPSTALFNDNGYQDSANPFEVVLSCNPGGTSGTFTCGQVFVDGMLWRQVARSAPLDEAEGCWRHVEATGAIQIRLPVGVDINSVEVEITTRRRIFAPHQRRLGYIHLIGFRMEHCGNQFPRNFWGNSNGVNTNAQAGALGTRSGNNWLIEGNVIRYSNTIGCDVGAESSGDLEDPAQGAVSGYLFVKNNRIINNWFIDNGAVGLTGWDSNGMEVRGNVIARNNSLRFSSSHGAFEQAGMKFHSADNCSITRNLVIDNDAYGIWLDNDNDNSRVTANLVVNNDQSGIYLEMAKFSFDEMVISHNCVLNSMGSGILSLDCSGSTIQHNFIAGTREQSWKRGAAIFHYLATPRIFVTEKDEQGNPISHVTSAHSRNNRVLSNLLFDNTFQMDANHVEMEVVPEGEYEDDYNLAINRRIMANITDGDPLEQKWLLNPTGRYPHRNNEGLDEHVEAILGSGAPLSEGARVAMDLPTWQQYWAQVDVDSGGDAGAAALGSCTYSLNRSSWELTVTLPAAFDSLLSADQTGEQDTQGGALFTEDYAGIPVTGDESEKPGPWSNLSSGTTVLHVWSGLELPAEGELPDRFSECQISYDTWSELYFSDQPAENALPGANPDSDRFVNILEYAFDLEPDKMASRTYPYSWEFLDGTLMFSFCRNPDKPDVIIEAQASNDLQNWLPIARSENGGEIQNIENRAFSVSETLAPDGRRLVEIIDNENRFIRLEVW